MSATSVTSRPRVAPSPRFQRPEPGDDLVAVTYELTINASQTYLSELMKKRSALEDVLQSIVELRRALKSLLPPCEGADQQQEPALLPSREELDKLSEPYGLRKCSTLDDAKSQFQNVLLYYTDKIQSLDNIINDKKKEAATLREKGRGLRLRMGVYRGLIANGHRIPEAEQHFAMLEGGNRRLSAPPSFPSSATTDGASSTAGSFMSCDVVTHTCRPMCECGHCSSDSDVDVSTTHVAKST